MLENKSKGKNTLRVLRNCLLIFLVAALLGTLLLVAAYALPVERMEDHVLWESISTFTRPFVAVEGYTSSHRDFNTDSLMLLHAIYDGDESLIEKSMLNYRNEYPGLDTVESLNALFHQVEGYQKQAYSRYWHGYLVFLKIFLLFFNYPDLWVFHMMLECLLVGYIIFLMTKMQISEYIFPFLCALLFMMPMAIAMSMQYASCFYIMLGALICILRMKRLSTPHLIYLFLAVGMASGYFDLLTYPLVTLGIPLAFVLARSMATGWKQNVVTVLLCAVVWAIGYFGFWFAKWAIGSLFTQRNLFIDALDQAKFRLSDNFRGIVYTYAIVLGTNMDKLNTFLYKALFLTSLGYMLYKAFRTPNTAGYKIKTALLDSVPLLMVALMPFTWYYFMRNHSAIHAVYTFRILTVSIMAMLFALATFQRKRGSALLAE